MGGLPALARRMARVLPHGLRQRIRAEGLRFAARRAALAAGAESGGEVIQDCALCGRTAVPHRLIGRVQPTHPGRFSRQDYRLLECGSCEAVYLDPLPSAADLELLYAGSVQFTESCYTDAAQVARLLDNYSRRLRRLDLYPRAGEALLEVGAGLAWVSRVCKLHDPGVVTVAQDVSGECAARCPWVDHYAVGPVTALPVERRFQLISLTHVIEHLPDPARMLQHLASRLEPGGRIYITAPFRPPLWQPHDGLRPWLSYSYLHVPAHISYLSRRWFERACEASGLRLLRWDPSHDGHQVFEVLLQRPVA